MIYLERKPRAPLDRCIWMLWYARASQIDHRRERALPSGRVEVILNLAQDFLTDCSQNAPERVAPSLVVGVRTEYELIDTSDLADLIGIVFRPGGFACFCHDAVDAFSHRSTALEDVWGGEARSLRERLQELASPESRLACLEHYLMTSYADRLGTSRVVAYAVSRFEQSSCMHAANTVRIEQVARETGFSVRHFSQMFREHTGVSPKVWCRIQRFLRAVRQMHSGVEVPWAELALDCGYYDQAHFANEFRAFSGINPSAYSAQRTQWAGHIRVD